MVDGVVDVISATWEIEVLRPDDLVMVFFWAEWCKPCMKVFTALSEVAKEYAGKVKIVRLNIDDQNDIASKYKISIVPTVIFFRRAQKLHEIICAVEKKQLAATIESLQS